MDKTTKLDPFNHGTWNTISTLVQLAAVVASIVLALRGEQAALLGLAALAGGSRGDLVRDLVAWLRNQNLQPPRTGSMVMLALTVGLLSTGCGTTISKQFLVDSQDAAIGAAGDYFNGCRMVTVAPAFSVDWNKNVTYGGGLFAGCEEAGRLMEFRCWGIPNEETGKVSVHCEALRLWERKNNDENDSEDEEEPQ